MAAETTLRQRQAGSNGHSAQVDAASVNKPADDPHAIEEHLEFGGAPGTFAMMTGFPALFYYLYVCLYFNDGTRSFFSRRRDASNSSRRLTLRDCGLCRPARDAQECPRADRTRRLDQLCSARRRSRLGGPLTLRGAFSFFRFR